jgi:hypothetical protein
MTAYHLSHHAQRRMQQRAIPPCLIDWLFEFGAEAYDHHGAQIRYFDRAAKRRLAEGVPAQEIAQFDQKLNAYLVESTDGTVITLAYRNKRLRRH